MSNPFAAEVELLILGLLQDEPKGLYGLELVRASNGKLKKGSVYVTLGRLEDKGFVVSLTKRDPTIPGLPRPIYKITPSGLKMLSAAELMGIKLAEV